MSTPPPPPRSVVLPAVGVGVLVILLVAACRATPPPQNRELLASVAGVGSILMAVLAFLRAREVPGEAWGWRMIGVAGLLLILQSAFALAWPLSSVPSPREYAPWVVLSTLHQGAGLAGLLLWPWKPPQPGERLKNLLAALLLMGSLLLLLGLLGSWELAVQPVDLAHALLLTNSLRFVLYGGVLFYLLAGNPRRMGGPLKWVLLNVAAAAMTSLALQGHLSWKVPWLFPFAALGVLHPFSFALAAWSRRPVEAESPALPSRRWGVLLYLPFILVLALVFMGTLRGYSMGRALAFAFLSLVLVILMWQWTLWLDLRRTNLQLEERVQARTRDLQESESRYRMLSENVGDVIWLVNYETLAVEYLSPSAEWTLGISAERARNQSIATLYPGVGRSFRVLLRRLSMQDAGGPTDSEDDTAVLSDIRLPGGRQMTLETKARLILDEAGLPRHVLAVSRDVTARKEAETALRVSEKLYRDLLTLHGEAVGVVDSQERFLMANAMAHEIFGVQPGTLVGRSILDFLPRGDVPKVASETEKRSVGLRSTYELAIIRPNGERRLLLVTAAPRPNTDPERMEVMGIFRDITDDAAAKDMVRKLSCAVNQSPSGILITDLDGIIEYVNEAFTAITGYAREEVIGQKPKLLRSGEHPRSFYVRLWATILHGDVWRGDIRNRRKDGSLYWERNIISPLRNDEGHITHFLANKTDISELMNAEDECRRLERQMNQAQKLECLGSLAGGLAHDINNVLAAIQGLASVQEEQAPPGTSLRHALETIVKACGRGGSLAKGLLGFARQGLAEEKVFDLNLLIRDLTDLLERTTLKRVAVLVDLEPDLQRIKGDPAALQHALMNLCVNGVDAMPEGGTLTLRTRNASPGITIDVIDTGEGMPKEVLDKAMDPFFTTKAQGKGTGLGLAMVFGTVKAHGGRLYLESAPGQGTQARIWLPSLTEAGEAQPSPSQEAGPARNLKVLVVDDDEMVREGFGMMLDQLGHEGVLVSCGETALTWLGRADADVVMLDLNMPGIGGSETLRRLRDMHPDLPVLLVTGCSDEEVQGLVEGLGPVILLTKPFDLTELRDALGKAPLRIPAE